MDNKTIAGLNDKPNNTINPVQNSVGENPNLSKIRQFKGTIKDFKTYWDDRLTGNN
jgi:hypothetical protein